MLVLPGDFDAKVDQIAGGFPGDLFVVLAGVTYLFAIAKNNGTVDWLVHAAMRSVRGRVALMPWVMFFVTAALTAVGAAGPAAVAMIAPIGIGFALRHKINPVLVGLMIVNGGARRKLLADRHFRLHHEQRRGAQRSRDQPAHAVHRLPRIQRAARRHHRRAVRRTDAAAGGDASGEDAAATSGRWPPHPSPRWIDTAR